MLGKVQKFGTPVGTTTPPLRTMQGGWQVLMMYTGKKTDSGTWVNNSIAATQSVRIAMGNPGMLNSFTGSLSNTGAENRQHIGDGQGLYRSFFTQTNITKVAFVDGSSFNKNPYDHTNYLVYNLVESTGSESIFQILKRLDNYQASSSMFHANDTVWGSSSVLYHSAGTSGSSGMLIASGGNQFLTTANFMPGSVRQFPNNFVVMGINRESDNDIQALCAFWGNLQTGKGDAWRNVDIAQSFWSYWGHDFHSNSQVQRIGGSLQSAPGVADNALYTGSVYLMAYSEE